MTSNNMDAVVEAASAAIVDQFLDGDAVVVDRVAWERLNPDPTPDREDDDGWAYFGEEAEARTSTAGPLVWNGRRWTDADQAEQAALDVLRAVAWARQEAQS